MKLIPTIIGAIVLMGFVVLALLIGKFLTGKQKLFRGTCGRIPQKKGESKKGNCSFCGSNESCEEEKKNDEDGSK